MLKILIRCFGGQCSSNEFHLCMLYTDGELVLSGSPLDNTGRTDVDTDFGECELKDVDEEDETIYPQWLSPYYNTTEDLPNAH